MDQTARPQQITKFADLSLSEQADFLRAVSPTLQASTDVQQMVESIKAMQKRLVAGAPRAHATRITICHPTFKQCKIEGPKKLTDKVVKIKKAATGKKKTKEKKKERVSDLPASSISKVRDIKK